MDTRIKSGSTAFVLGNGKSRTAVDLNELRTFGMVYGCNALYRDFKPDVLVSTDPGISEEIQKSGFPKQRRHYTRKPFENSGSMRIEQYHMYSSGPICLNYACLDGHYQIYLLGVDFTSPNGKFNNVYADTENYKASTDSPTFHGNWVNQFREIMQKYPKKRFTRVVAPYCEIPEKWNDVSNLTHINVDDFLINIQKRNLDG